MPLREMARDGHSHWGSSRCETPQWDELDTRVRERAELAWWEEDAVNKEVDGQRCRSLISSRPWSENGFDSQCSFDDNFQNCIFNTMDSSLKDFLLKWSWNLPLGHIFLFILFLSSVFCRQLVPCPVTSLACLRMAMMPSQVSLLWAKQFHSLN